MNHKHIIFDLDGTLIDSKEEIISTYQKVFIDLAPPAPVDFNLLNFGSTLTSILNQVYCGDKELINQARLRFADIYDNSSYENTLLYPKTYELLSQLKECGVICHIATNKRFTPTLNILERKQILNFFSSIKASDMVKGIVTTKKEMVSKICEEYNIQIGLMIGDSIQDIEAGTYSKLKTVAVGYGYETTENLLKANADYFIHHLSDLYNILLANNYFAQ